MYAQLLARRRRSDEGVSVGLLGGAAEPSAPKKGPLGFKERGFSFVSIRQAHLNYLASVYDCKAPTLDEVVGRTMVDEFYLPLGVVLTHLKPSGNNVLYAHFGTAARWLKTYPAAILRGMKEVANELRGHEIYILDAFTDESVDESVAHLLEWLGAKPITECRGDGLWWRLDLRRCKI